MAFGGQLGGAKCAACKKLGKAPLSVKVGWWVKMRAKAGAFDELPAPADALEPAALAAVLRNERSAYAAPSPDPRALRALETAAGAEWRARLKCKEQKKALAASLALLSGAKIAEDEDEDGEGKDGEGSGGDDEDESKATGGAAGSGEPAEESEDDEADDDGVTSSWATCEGIRKQAATLGLIRPLLALLSMSHAERQQVAGGLRIALADTGAWGDPHREAKAILWGLKGRALQTRMSDVVEMLDTGAQGPKPNWYETVYRVMMHARGAAIGVAQQRKSGGRSAENKGIKKDTIFAFSVHAALDPNSAAMAAAEHALDCAAAEELEARGLLLPYGEVSRGATRGSRNPARLKIMNRACEMVEMRRAHAPGSEVDEHDETIHEAAYMQVAMYPAPEDAEYELFRPQEEQRTAADVGAAVLKKMAAGAWKQLAPKHLKTAAKVAAFAAKLMKMAAEMKFGAEYHRCVGSTLRIARQCKRLGAIGGGEALAGGYDTLQLHCVGCEKKELGWTEGSCSSSTAGWVDVAGGSRWMFTEEKHWGRRRWHMRHVVLRDGVLETHKTNAPLPPGSEFGSKPCVRSLATNKCFLVPTYSPLLFYSFPSP